MIATLSFLIENIYNRYLVLLAQWYTSLCHLTEFIPESFRSGDRLSFALFVQTFSSYITVCLSLQRTHLFHWFPRQMSHQGFQRFDFFNRVISLTSVVQRETTLTVSVSTGEPVTMESEIVRVVSLCTKEMSKITRLKKSDICRKEQFLFFPSMFLYHVKKVFLSCCLRSISIWDGSKFIVWLRVHILVHRYRTEPLNYHRA